jgi:hypothetical protein
MSAAAQPPSQCGACNLVSLLHPISELAENPQLPCKSKRREFQWLKLVTDLIDIETSLPGLVARSQEQSGE